MTRTLKWQRLGGHFTNRLDEQQGWSRNQVALFCRTLRWMIDYGGSMGKTGVAD